MRRGMTLFALPHHAAEGAALIWGTADRIWTTLGDSSRDVNWYTKRATLSGVYSSTLLYWLGDHSADHADTRAFLDRRIEDVMRFEKLKAGLRDNALLSGLMAGPLKLLDRAEALGLDDELLRSDEQLDGVARLVGVLFFGGEPPQRIGHRLALLVDHIDQEVSAVIESSATAETVRCMGVLTHSTTPNN